LVNAIVPPLGGGIPKLGGIAIQEFRRLSDAMASI
jgi:hypothetical protein